MEENEVIYNTSRTHFGFLDRLKILIGGIATTRLIIETSTPVVIITKSTATTFVRCPSWVYVFKRNKGGGICYPAKLDTSKTDWVFWIEFSKTIWFKKIWTTRGANFREIVFFGLCISIGLPWLQNYLESNVTYDLKEHVNRVNFDNLKYKASLLVKRS
jgi:hypothetical protein